MDFRFILNTETTNAPRKRSTPPNEVAELERVTKRRRSSARPAWAVRVEHGSMLAMQEFVFKPRENKPKDTARESPVMQKDPRPRIPLRVDTNGSGRGSVSAHEPQSSAVPQTSRPWESERAGDLEWSLDNNVPYNGMTRVVSEFFYQNVLSAPRDALLVGELEIEARLGVLVNDQGNRCSLPVQTECVLAPELGLRFESLMDMVSNLPFLLAMLTLQPQHKLLNDYLNYETRRSNNTPGRKPIAYKHTRERDRFYKCPDHWLNSLPVAIHHLRERHKHRTPRVRVTTNHKTNEVLASIVKIRVDDLEIFCPTEPFDVRISVSIELKYPSDQLSGLVEVQEQGHAQTRLKDRLSYKHQDLISIDLTQVKQEATGQKIHELELEMETKDLMKQGHLMAEGQPNHFEPMVGIYLNYIRVLNRAAMPHPEVGGPPAVHG
jgi:hypothetical protein